MQAPEQGRIIDFGSLFGRWEVTRSTADTGGELFETRVTVDAPIGAGPPLHVHHHAEERYRVLSGTLEVNIAGKWQQLAAGETLTVPPGTPHTLKSDVPVVLINTHTPALDFEHFFRRFHALVTERGVRVPPKDLKSAMLMGMLFTAHARENVTVQPPQPVMRCLAALGRLLGYRLPD